MTADGVSYGVLHGDTPRTLAWSADPRRRFASRTTTPLYQHQPPRGTASQTVNSLQLLSLCGCGSRHLETAN